MLNKDFASVTARIAAANKPEFAIANTPDLGMDFANAIKSYTDNEKKQKLINALQGGDPEQINIAAAAYDPQGQLDYIQRIKQARADADLAFERQKELASINNAAALERAKLTYGNNQGLGKGEFGSLMQFRNSDAFNTLPVEQQELLDSRLAYLSNNPELGYEQAYQKKRGSKQAEQEFERAANVQAANQRASNLRKVIADVQGTDAKMFTPVASIQSKLGAFGDIFGSNDFGGMTWGDRKHLGNLGRAIDDIGQSLIARAKAQGQAGINTLAEIERIVGNISMSKGKPELEGALQQLLEQEQAIIALETRSNMSPTNSGVQGYNFSNVSNDELLGSIL